MSEAPHFCLLEHAVGYALLKIKEFEDIGQMIPEVDAAIGDAARFSSIVKLQSFDPFRNTEAALANCNMISEGLVHQDLQSFLEANLPKKLKKVVMGIADAKLAGALTEALPGLRVVFSGVVQEIMRGARVHFEKLAQNLPHASLSKAQLSLGHSYSRSKVKFDVHRVDNMVIQSIALLDQMDKDINQFAMRIREWYSYHFPELWNQVSDQYKYLRCAIAILNRETIEEKGETLVQELTEILDGDEEKTAAVLEAARTSMGMEISDMDLINIQRFASRVASLSEYRQALHAYIKDRMASCAPSLSALIGEQVGARLISRAGSLTNLSKFPASTIQILGAEKALFRALKTRSNTPKFGLIFHSSFIGRAPPRHKGRISRFLANKCAIASRIDCYSEVAVPTYGEFLRDQVEERLKYYATGEKPAKNVDVMAKAGEVAEGAKQKVLKKRKKAEKRAHKSENGEEPPVTEDTKATANGDDHVENGAGDENDEPKSKKKKKKSVSKVEVEA